MTVASWILSGVFALVVAAIAIEAYLKRNRRQPLSKFQPKPRVMTEKVELGQEEANTKVVNRIHEKK